MKNDFKSSKAAFYLFPKLPIELRCLIWRLSMVTPRRIHIMNVCDNNKTSLPASSAANRESRAEFLSMYTRLFLEPPKNKPRVSFVTVTVRDGPNSGQRDYCATSSYANLSQDALLIGYDDLMRAKQSKRFSWSKSLTPQAMQSLKHLIFYIGSDPVSRPPDHSSIVQFLKVTTEDLETQLSVFKSLETLYLKVPSWEKHIEDHLQGMEILKGRPTVNVEFLGDSDALGWSC